MGPKNVVASAFTRLRASNLGTTTKIYHRIRNVKNAERNEKREGRKKNTRTYVRTYTEARAKVEAERSGKRGGRATAARRRRQQGVDP